MSTINTLDTMRAAQRAYEANPSHDTAYAAVEAQRAHEAAREDARRDAEAAAWRARRDALIARVEGRLSRPIPEVLDTAPVGLCSHKQAEYLMMAPSVAGGAIWVNLGVPESLDPGWDRGLGRWYLALGDMAVQRVLDRRRVIQTLRDEARRLAPINGGMFADDVEALIIVIDRLEAEVL